jgi:hypothetical protein
VNDYEELQSKIVCFAGISEQRRTLTIPSYLTRNEQVSGSSPLVGSLVFLGLEGELIMKAKPQGRYESLHTPVGKQRARATLLSNKLPTHTVRDRERGRLLSY